MIRIVHVSDLHFGKSIAQDRMTGALLQGIKQKYGFRIGGENYLMVTGDITNDGTESQYDQARRALIPFIGQVLMVPGNHDYGPVGNFYSRAAARDFDDFARSLCVSHVYINNEPCVRVIEGDGVRVLTIGLNSVQQTPTFFDWARGRIGNYQLALLSSILVDGRHAGLKKVVYLHHRPHQGDKVFRVMELEDRDELMDVVRGKADVLAFGHEGAMEIESRAAATSDIPIATGAMRVSGPSGGCLLLDADDSVALQKCYVMDFDSPGKLEASVVEIPREAGLHANARGAPTR